MALLDTKEAHYSEISRKWRCFSDLGGHTVLLVCSYNTNVRFAPLYIHSFQLLLPRSFIEAVKFNTLISDTAQIDSVADKLRWYRYKNSLLQSDVAEYIGVDRGTYIRYENVRQAHYPLDKLEKIAELFGVSVTALFDGYNQFLYDGQSAQIKNARNELRMTQAELAAALNVHKDTVAGWESGSCKIQKNTWLRFVDLQAGTNHNKN